MSESTMPSETPPAEAEQTPTSETEATTSETPPAAPPEEAVAPEETPPLEEALTNLQARWEEIKRLTGSLSTEHLAAVEEAINAVGEHARALLPADSKKTN
jgi:hypothetical protein